MGTSFETIETRAMTYIKNDMSLDSDLTNRLPLFYNRMKAYMLAGKAYFNKPPKMQCILSRYIEPQFDEIFYTPESSQSAPVTISTNIKAYDICSIGLIVEDVYGTPEYKPMQLVSYDAETGDVVVDADLTAGDNVVIDFYASGTFEADLTDEQIELLAYCVYVAWENRFINNVIERTAKIRDTGFSPISEASQMESNTERMKLVNDTLQDWLRRYEQNTAYVEVVGL